MTPLELSAKSRGCAGFRYEHASGPDHFHDGYRACRRRCLHDETEFVANGRQNATLDLRRNDVQRQNPAMKAGI